MNKVVIFILCFAPFLLMGNALAWDGVPAWEKPLPSVSPPSGTHYQSPSQYLTPTEHYNQFREKLDREIAEARDRERHMGETAYRNRHSSIYISGCHHYSESCRMQLRD